MRNRHGMTLMELMVGIAITAMMAASGAAAFTSLIDHRAVIKRSTVDTERAAALRDVIRQWIQQGSVQIQQGGGPRLGRTASAASSAVPGMSASANSAAQAAGDELDLVTDAPNPTMLTGVRLRLYVDVDAGTPEKGLTIEYQPNTQTPLQRAMLDSTIDSLTVEFLDQRTNRWFSASQAATITPWAVRLTLLHTQGNRIAMPRLLQVPMIFKMPTATVIGGRG